MKILLIKDNTVLFISRETISDFRLYGIDINEYTKNSDAFLIKTVIPMFIYNLFKSKNKYKIQLALNLSYDLQLITKS